MKPTHKLALTIAVALTLWMFSGLLFSDKQSAPTESENFTMFKENDGLSKVRVKYLTAKPQHTEITVQGRTEAKRVVDIKAEIGGRIIATPVEKGQRVEKSQALCQLAEDAHGAVLLQANANYKKSLIDYEGALKLKAKKLLSDTNIAANKAALANAKANLKIAQVNMDHLTIRAPFAGFIEDRPVEVGALIRHGEICARLIDESTILATGQISEQEVAALHRGQTVRAQLAGGSLVSGKITFVGRVARTQTRTYPIEATLNITGEQVRTGSTAQIFIPLEEVLAYQISPAVLTLSDDGSMGVRIVNSDNIVEFHLVTIVRESPEGVWVNGLPSEIKLITVGQEYVADGDTVETVADNFGEKEKQQTIANKQTSLEAP